MTKKKIGELEGTPIVTGDKNYANEHEYYMTLNGDNTYLKLEQRTNGDLFRLVLGGGNDSGSGCDCNGFKYNELPEPAQFRDPTEEEDNPEIFGANASGQVLKVLDLKDGIVPKEIIIENSDNGGFDIYQLTGYKFDMNQNRVDYCMCISGSSATDIATTLDGNVALISTDGTLLGILDLGIE